MTLSEKNLLESFNSHAISDSKVKKGIGAFDGIMTSHEQGVTFADALYSITAQNVDAWTSKEDKAAQKEALVDRICKTPIAKLLYYAREKWTGESFYTPDSSSKGCSVNEEALSQVEQQLVSEGIDVENRTPTHDITDEQLEWLAARYDPEYLRSCSITDPEFGNFMLDLAYLNVFSLDEVKNMFTGIFPPESDQPEFISLYYYGDPDTGAGAGYVSQINGNILSYEEWLDERRSIIAGNYVKAENPGLTDDEYREMSEKLVAQYQQRVNILEEIFERFADLARNTMENTFLINKIENIEDASEKLKEDFGRALA